MDFSGVNEDFTMELEDLTIEIEDLYPLVSSKMALENPAFFPSYKQHLKLMFDCHVTKG